MITRVFKTAFPFDGVETLPVCHQDRRNILKTRVICTTAS